MSGSMAAARTQGASMLLFTLCALRRVVLTLLNRYSVRFPFFCLARQQRTWWAARAASYEQPSPSKGGKRAIPGKFVVEWTDGTSGKVSRKDLLTPTDSAFFTVAVRPSSSDLLASLASRTGN